MKKFLTAIFVFLSLFTLGLSFGVKAETVMVEKEIYSTGFEDTTTDTDYQGTVKQTSKDVEWQIYYGNFTTTNPLSGGQSVQMRLYSSAKDKFGYLKTENKFSNVSKVKFIYKVSNTDLKMKVTWKGANNVSGEDTISPSNTRQATYEKQFDELISDFSLTIQISDTSTAPSKKNYQLSIDDIYIYTKEEATTYSVSFDANGGTFAEGKGTAIENIANGTNTEVTLPTSADLTKTLYETDTKYTTLKGWSDGTKTYEPDEKVTVSSATTFTAIYEATEAINSVINVEEALKICQLTGNNNTICKFIVAGKIKKIDKEYSEQYKNITVIITDGTNDLMLFRLSGGADLTVGDEILATGELKIFNSTSEMDAGCTYVMSSKVECANFIKNETHSSLIVSYDGELNPTNVDLRLGGTITADSYLSGATYGVLVTEGSKELTAGKTTYRTVEEFIAANAGFKNVTCTPARVNESGVEDENGQKYQFAWVLTDMEGHYDTTMTAVMYMIYDGALYICKAKTTSVLGTVAQYLENTRDFEFTEEQKTVLNNIKA